MLRCVTCSCLKATFTGTKRQFHPGQKQRVQLEELELQESLQSCLQERSREAGLLQEDQRFQQVCGVPAGLDQSLDSAGQPHTHTPCSQLHC